MQRIQVVFRLKMVNLVVAKINQFERCLYEKPLQIFALFSNYFALLPFCTRWH